MSEYSKHLLENSLRGESGSKDFWGALVTISFSNNYTQKIKNSFKKLINEENHRFVEEQSIENLSQFNVLRIC